MYIAENQDTPCQMADPEDWFAKSNTSTALHAKRACYDCPERIDCLTAVVTLEQHKGELVPGIYGGLDPDERRSFLELHPAASA